MYLHMIDINYNLSRLLSRKEGYGECNVSIPQAVKENVFEHLKTKLVMTTQSLQDSVIKLLKFCGNFY